MNIQKWILAQKNTIMVIQLILISVAFVGHWGLHDERVALVGFGVAGVLGIAPILVQAIGSVRVRVVSIDVLVAIASIGAMLIRNFEEAAIVTFLFIFGSWLEGKTLNYTRKSIKNLTDMAPDTAYVLQDDGAYHLVDVDDVDQGDTIQVKTGGKVPVDGTILSGEGYVNQASITGEGIPVKRGIGDMIYAGTILENGTLVARADRVGEDSTFGRIIELVEEAQDAKSSTEKFINRFSKYYTPAVLLLGMVIGLVTRDVALAITILVLGCPGALVIGVPVSNVAGIGNGAKNGILLKGSEVIQDLARVDTIIFDKTGTLTLGHPEVDAMQTYSPDAQAALRALVAIEKESDHPLAQAIVRHFNLTSTPVVTHTEVVKGGGIRAIVEGVTYVVGNERLIRDAIGTIPDTVTQDIEAFQAHGQSIVLLASGGTVHALMGIRDPIRPNVRQDLQSLRTKGVKQLILASGDNQATVDLVVHELGLDKGLGNMLPEDKNAFVTDLQGQGHRVAFVGDGVNDSPSLASADIGIAMGSGTDVAIETSDVILVHSDLEHLHHALGLSRATYTNMRQNILIALAVVGALIGMLLFTQSMTMSLGMLVHEGSILLVILNGMRLLRYRNRNLTVVNET